MRTNKKIRVVHIHRDKQIGGKSIEKVFSLVEKNIGGNFEIIPYFYNEKNSLLRNIWKILSLKADVIHITGYINFVAIFLFFKKTIITVHDVGHFERGLNGIKKHIYGFLYFSLPLRFCDKITTVSSFTKERIMHWFNISSDKINVIYNPIPEYAPSTRKFDNNKPVILQVGTNPNKNVPSLIKALNGISCHLHLVGRLSPEILSDLALNNISYSNEENISEKEIENAYKNSDIVALLSFYEGFGLPIIEANIAGKPLIVSNVTSIPEVAGKSALIVEPFNIQQINKGINELINNEELRESLVKEGFKNALRFDQKKIATEYANLYQQIIS